MNDVKKMEELNNLERIVIDKRNDKRAGAKKERRNRHYIKVLIKQQIKHISEEPQMNKNGIELEP